MLHDDSSRSLTDLRMSLACGSDSESGTTTWQLSELYPERIDRCVDRGRLARDLQTLWLV